MIMDRRYSQSTRIIAMACVAAVALFACSPALAASPDGLRYGGLGDQVVGYRIEISADREGAVDTLEGVVRYEAKFLEKDVFRASYKGGLTRSSKAKPSSGSSAFGSPRFGPSFFGRSRGFSPFSNLRFKGLITTTNELTFNSKGEVQSMEGDSQLPYLLGNASLLVFEPLPAKPRESWSANTGISITEEGGRRGFPYHSLPFGRGESKQTTIGSEILTYKIRSVDGPNVIVDKTYRLNSPAVGQDISAFEINGTGTWTFNSELGLSESMEFKQKLIVQKGNTTVTFPMTIRYNRMSDDELNTYEEEQKKKQEEAKKRLAEVQEKEAKTPLTEQEIQKILKDLDSDNASLVITTLQRLQKKRPKKSDPRIAMAVDALREHENQFVHGYVEKAAEIWPLPEGVLSVAARKRTWSDSTGTFNVEAEFLELQGDTVYLRRNDGKELEVPLDLLSDVDQEAARELAKAPKPVIDNPFE
jgi:SLA1 Homology Domain 1 (SHD1) protein